jgi:hypothetical protein
MMNRALILLSFTMAACEVGEVPVNGVGIDAPVIVQPPVDAGPPPIDAPIVPLCVARQNPANVAHIHSAGATTHAGENCIVGGCHHTGNVGTGAPAFQFAGTLYGGDGVTPNAGATLHFKNAAGVTKDTTTDKAGNFYLNAGTLTQGFPAMVSASVCPTPPATGNPAPTPMTEAVQSTGGGCALAGCHTPNAGQGVVKLDPTI